jgi:hypothetical protein
VILSIQALTIKAVVVEIEVESFKNVLEKIVRFALQEPSSQNYQTSRKLNSPRLTPTFASAYSTKRARMGTQGISKYVINTKKDSVAKGEDFSKHRNTTTAAILAHRALCGFSAR